MFKSLVNYSETDTRRRMFVIAIAFIWSLLLLGNIVCDIVLFKPVLKDTNNPRNLNTVELFTPNTSNTHEVCTLTRPGLHYDFSKLTICDCRCALSDDIDNEAHNHARDLTREENYVTRGESEMRALAITRPKPDYPDFARLNKIGGEVVVEIVVNEEGRVVEAFVLRGPILLRDAALTAARRWRFQTTRMRNRPVKVRSLLTFNFHLP